MSSNLAYQEEFWEELINGRVVAMSPRPVPYHNRIAENIDFIFRVYLKGKQCVPLGDGYDLFLTAKDHFIPDFMIICDRSKIKRNGVFGAPDLVVEVLSPSTAMRDRGYKKSAYEACGAAEYWIVDPENKSVEVYLLQDGKYVLDNLYILYPDYMLEKMTDEEKSALATKFKCHLYDDLIIDLNEIFETLF